MIRIIKMITLSFMIMMMMTRTRPASWGTRWRTYSPQQIPPSGLRSSQKPQLHLDCRSSEVLQGHHSLSQSPPPHPRPRPPNMQIQKYKYTNTKYICGIYPTNAIFLRSHLIAAVLPLCGHIVRSSRITLVRKRQVWYDPTNTKYKYTSTEIRLKNPPRHCRPPPLW